MKLGKAKRKYGEDAGFDRELMGWRDTKHGADAKIP